MKAYLFSLTFIFFALPLSGYDFNTYLDVKNFNKSDKYSQESESKETNYRIKKVVIDAGHGGKDSGCVGHSRLEKDLALKIALKLGRSMKHAFPQIEVIYTRKTDVFVPLHRRAEIANRHQADLFISIHCNAVKNASHVTGTETYVMGLHTADANLAVAKRENASILLEDNYVQQYQGYDPHSPEGHIILSMYQNAHLDKSIRFAEKVESNLKSFTRRKSRGVKQAGFLVLRETTMPSVLIEAGYLTNQSDHDYLATEAGQQTVAQSILNAFKEYKREVENGSTEVVLARNYPNYKSAAKVQVPQQPSHYQQQNQQTKAVIKSPTKVANTRLPIQYKILLAASDQLIDTKQKPWISIDYSVQVLEEEGLYKYFVIGFKSYDTAAKAKTKLRKMGFQEAFVVGYQGNRRVFPK